MSLKEIYKKLVKLIEDLCSNKESPSHSKASKNSLTCKIYSVKGKNPDTKQTNTIEVVVESSEALENIQKKSGLLPPFEIKEILPVGATERQIDYAKNIGLSLPKDATKLDASIFLTRYEDRKPLYPPPMPQKILRYLIEKGIYVPSYAGKAEAHNLYFYNIDLTEQIAYFGMKVYCNLKGKKYCLLEDAEPAQRNLFYEFAQQYKNNSEFTKSLSHYSGNDLPIDSCTISKKLKAYHMAVDFFVK